MERDRLNAALAALSIPAPGPPPPALLVLSGLPGTGKSRLAHALTDRRPFCVVGSDSVRRALFAVRTYSPAEHGATYTTCHGVIRHLLAAGVWTIFDATNLRRRDRRQALALGVPFGARVAHIQLQTSAEVALHRLQTRSAAENPAFGSEADARVYLELLEHFQPEPADSACVLDGARPIDDLIREAERMLGF